MEEFLWEFAIEQSHYIDKLEKENNALKIGCKIVADALYEANAYLEGAGMPPAEDL